MWPAVRWAVFKGAASPTIYDDLSRYSMQVMLSDVIWIFGRVIDKMAQVLEQIF